MFLFYIFEEHKVGYFSTEPEPEKLKINLSLSLSLEFFSCTSCELKFIIVNSLNIYLLLASFTLFRFRNSLDFFTDQKEGNQFNNSEGWVTRTLQEDILSQFKDGHFKCYPFTFKVFPLACKLNHLTYNGNIISRTKLNTLFDITYKKCTQAQLWLMAILNRLLSIL